MLEFLHKKGMEGLQLNQMKKSMTSVILATALAAPMMIPATAAAASGAVKFKPL